MNRCNVIKLEPDDRLQGHEELQRLYEGHEVKEEMVTGPVEVQRPDATEQMQFEIHMGDQVIKEEPKCEDSDDISSRAQESAATGPVRYNVQLKLEPADQLDEGQEEYILPIELERMPGAPAPRRLKLDTKIEPAVERSSRSEENKNPGVEVKAPVVEESNTNTSSPPVHSEATDTQEYKQRKTKFVTPKIKKTKADKADQKPVFKTPRKLQTKSKPYSLPKKRKLGSQNEQVRDNTPKASVCEYRASTIKEPKGNGITHLVGTPNISKFQSKPLAKKASETNAPNDTNKNCASDNVFPCNACSKQFNTKALLIQHVHSHTSNFNCSECGYSTAARDTFEKHLKLHDKSRAYQCDVCGYRFVTKLHLQRHISSVHMKHKVSLKRYSCDILLCDYKTDYLCNLKRHLNVHRDIKPYSCTMCTYRCTEKSTLKTHERTHTGEKPFRCSICTYKCTAKSSLKTHELTHTGEKPFSCSVCTYKCVKKSLFQAHERTHTGEKPFSCSVCIFKSASKCGLKKHERTHTSEKPFNCSVCDYKTDYLCNLKRHLNVHRDIKPYSCTMCTYRCTEKSTLKRHERTHTGEKPFRCSVCTYKCVKKSLFQAHERTHTGEKPFSCSVCIFKSASKCGLKKHERTHTGEKPFRCSVCTYKCTGKSDLKTHELTHTGEKPFSCSVCTYKCAKKSHLQAHERTHTGEKPFSCTVCIFKSASKCGLKKHERTHTGEKPFNCSVCTYKCAHKSGLKRHEVLHTGEKPFSCSVCTYKCAIKTDLKRHETTHTSKKPIIICSICKYIFAKESHLTTHYERAHARNKFRPAAV